ncbi:MAG: hypothetical protein RAO75_06565 [Candidatus Chlorobium antarcticum]|nr:hypothetical protein [Candidatus Chlorobium antarcticum]
MHAGLVFVLSNGSFNLRSGEGSSTLPVAAIFTPLLLYLKLFIRVSDGMLFLRNLLPSEVR